MSTGPSEQRAGLGVDGEDEVDHLDVVVRADVADRVGRVDPPAEDGEVVLVAEALEVRKGRAHGRGHGTRLDDGIGGGALGGRRGARGAALLGKARRAGGEGARRACEDGQGSGDVVGDVVGEDGASLVGVVLAGVVATAGAASAAATRAAPVSPATVATSCLARCGDLTSAPEEGGPLTGPWFSRMPLGGPERGNPPLSVGEGRRQALNSRKRARWLGSGGTLGGCGCSAPRRPAQATSDR